MQVITASFLMNWSCDSPTAIYSSLLIWSLINWNSNSSSVTFLCEKATWQFFVSIQFGGVPKHPFQDQCYNIESDIDSGQNSWILKIPTRKVIYLVFFLLEFCSPCFIVNIFQNRWIMEELELLLVMKSLMDLTIKVL